MVTLHFQQPISTNCDWQHIQHFLKTLCECLKITQWRIHNALVFFTSLVSARVRRKKKATELANRIIWTNFQHRGKGEVDQSVFCLIVAKHHYRFLFGVPQRTRETSSVTFGTQRAGERTCSRNLLSLAFSLMELDLYPDLVLEFYVVCWHFLQVQVYFHNVYFCNGNTFTNRK